VGLRRSGREAVRVLEMCFDRVCLWRTVEAGCIARKGPALV